MHYSSEISRIQKSLDRSIEAFLFLKFKIFNVIRLMQLRNNAKCTERRYSFDIDYNDTKMSFNREYVHKVEKKNLVAYEIPGSFNVFA